MISYAAALLAEARGDDVEAYALLRRSWEYDAARDDRTYHRFVGPALVRHALARDELELATTVAEAVKVGADLAPEVATVRCAWLRCRALLDADTGSAMATVEAARGSPRVLDVAAACTEAARILVSHGDSQGAVALFLEASGHYEALGARAWSGLVAAELRGLGVRRGARGTRGRPTHGWASLTDSERGVAELVAQGLTNREVARNLHLSPHTVNSHLRHVFEKLGVSNRVGLAADLARHVGCVPPTQIARSSDVSPPVRRHDEPVRITTQEGPTMPSVGFAIPVLPGKTDVDRDALGSCWRGERRATYEDARRRAGVTKETVWIQTTPMGDLAVIYLEADDLEAAFGTIGGSGEPFDQWFRDHVQDVHGISLADGMPIPELILDFDSEV